MISRFRIYTTDGEPLVQLGDYEYDDDCRCKRMSGGDELYFKDFVVSGWPAGGRMVDGSCVKPEIPNEIILDVYMRGNK